MNPSPSAIAAIRARVADWSADDATIAAALNAPDRPNPAPRPTVPVPLTVADAMGVVDPENRAKVYARPSVVAFRNDVRNGDLVGAFAWVSLAVDAGDLTPAEAGAIAALARRTQPDPSWPPQISWAVATLGRPVDPADVFACRPEEG